MLRGVAAAIARETSIPGMQPPYFCSVGVVGRRFHATPEPPHDFFAPSQHMLRALPHARFGRALPRPALDDGEAPDHRRHGSTTSDSQKKESVAASALSVAELCRAQPVHCATVMGRQPWQMLAAMFAQRGQNLSTQLSAVHMLNLLEY